ncbi:hypothetical protein C8Q77DRAFT_312704 [Trametes polyzona]|nr:hypothetical protein C8Q77DRAFT_312704 [Trametes polyzona]
MGSSSALHNAYPSSQHTPSFFSDNLDDEVCHIEDCSPDAQLPSSPALSWIGRGDAGILAWAQSVPSGAPSDDEPATLTRPKLLDLARTPVKPSLYMSRAQPAPPEPSRPILTPQQSLPSLSRDSTSMHSASVLSLTTGSSSYSLATPATGSVAGSVAVYDCTRPAGGKHGLLSGLKAQLRVLSSTTSLKEKQHRSATVTRPDTNADLAASREQKTRRASSPVSFYHMPEQYLPTKRKEGAARGPAMKENAHAPPVSKRAPAAVEDHPAYRARGRKPSRFAS